MLHGGGRRRINEAGAGVAMGDGDGGIERARGGGVQTVLYTVSKRMFWTDSELFSLSIFSLSLFLYFQVGIYTLELWTREF